MGRIEGKVVFVPFTAPGDIAEVEIAAEHRSFTRGRLAGLITRAARRTPPLCPLFGTCGGCQWQHLPYEDQLAAKGALLSDTLRRIGGLEAPSPLSVGPSPLRYGYRHRCRLQAGGGEPGKALGFFRAGTHRVVPVEHCPVLHSSLNRMLPILTRTVLSHPRLFRPLRSIDLGADYRGATVRASFRADRKALTLPPSVREELAGLSAGEGLILTGPGDGEKGLTIGSGRDAPEATGDAFTQVNLRQNRELVKEVLQWVQPAPGLKVLDLYCGLGNFSLPLAARGAAVLGIDGSGSSIRCARANARRLGPGSARFQRGRADSAVRSLADDGERFDTIILNPPRSGAKETVPLLPSLSPSRVLVVSCDPATFARDAAALNSSGYRLDTLRGLDLFPQTFHIETMALFTAPGGRGT